MDRNTPKPWQIIESCHMLFFFVFFFFFFFFLFSFLFFSFLFSFFFFFCKESRKLFFTYMQLFPLIIFIFQSASTFSRIFFPRFTKRLVFPCPSWSFISFGFVSHFVVVFSLIFIFMFLSFYSFHFSFLL